MVYFLFFCYNEIEPKLNTLLRFLLQSFNIVILKGQLLFKFAKVSLGSQSCPFGLEKIIMKKFNIWDFVFICFALLVVIISMVVDKGNQITPQGLTFPVVPLRSTPPQGETFSRDLDYDCKDFGSWEEAQKTYEKNRVDIHDLDRNNNGIACEGLRKR